MFDARVKTYTERKAYTDFLKELKKDGYVSLQKSVYVKYSDSCASFLTESAKIDRVTPKSIQVRLLKLTYAAYLQIVDINCEKVVFYEKEDVICV